MDATQIREAVNYELETYKRRTVEARQAIAAIGPEALTGYSPIEWLIKSEAMLAAWAEAHQVLNAGASHADAITYITSRLIQWSEGRSTSAVSDAISEAKRAAFARVLGDLQSMSR